MILLGLGGNLPSRFGAPAETQAAALALLERTGVRVLRRSRLWHSAPVPASDQPWFVNAVVQVETPLAPLALLRVLLATEQAMGRVRGRRNGPRSLDIDLLAYGETVSDSAPLLPHPRLHERSFVLEPLAEIAPGWRHPRLGLTATQLLAQLGAAGSALEPLA